MCDRSNFHSLQWHKHPLSILFILVCVTYLTAGTISAQRDVSSPIILSFGSRGIRMTYHWRFHDCRNARLVYRSYALHERETLLSDSSRQMPWNMCQASLAFDFIHFESVNPSLGVCDLEPPLCYGWRASIMAHSWKIAFISLRSSTYTETPDVVKTLDVYLGDKSQLHWTLNFVETNES